MSDVVEILLLAAEQGDMGRKPDPSDYRRRAAAEITRLRAREDSLSSECDHWMSEANRLRLQVASLTANAERAWTERNHAVAKVKAWESVVYVEGLPLRAVCVDEWGPGEGDQVTVPEITRHKLTELLDRLASLTAAVEGERERITPKWDERHGGWR